MEQRLTYNQIFFIFPLWYLLIGQKPNNQLIYHDKSITTNIYTYKNKNVTIDKNNVQKKIFIQGISNKIFQTQLKKSFNIDNLEKMPGYLKQIQIINLLTRMKLSGYFKKIQIKSEIVNKVQNVNIDCTIMPILKYIKLKDNKQISIPEHLVYKAFSGQIGQPKNFKLIQESIKKIYKWYYSKGYHWVQIEINQQKTQDNYIELTISEGCINSIQFKFDEQIGYLHNEEQTKCIHLLRAFLNIKEHSPLNYQYIESRLDELKNKKIFSSCDYTVIPSKNDPKTIDILISIYGFPHKTVLLVGKNTRFTAEVIESIESHILNSINTFFLKSFPSNIHREINLKNNKFTTHIDVGTTNTIEIVEKNPQFIIDHILAQSNYYHLRDLYEWYAQPINFVIDNNLSILYNINNLNRKKDFASFRFVLPNIYKNFTLIYSKPWIDLPQKQTLSLQLKLIQQSFYEKNKQITNLISTIFDSHFVLSGLLCNIKTIQSKARIRLNKNVVIKLVIVSKGNTYRRSNLKEQKKCWTAASYQELEKKHRCYNTLLYSISSATKKTISSIFSIGVKIIYNKGESKDINWVKQGNYFTLSSKYFLPINYIKNTTHNYNYNFANRTIIKSTLYKINNFIEKKCIFTAHCFLFDIEIGWLSGSSTFFPYLEQFELSSPEAIRGYANNIIAFPKSFYKNSIEYHLVSGSNHSFFLFIDSLHKNQRSVFRLTEDIIKLLLTQKAKEESSNKMSIGIGYQLKTFIRRLPPIRIEYTINMLKEQSVTLRVTQVLSTITKK
nr:hypothetical protein [Erythrocladia irregularis]